MPELPLNSIIKSTIQSGSVYYFPDEALHSPDPHYFVVLNISPVLDRILILVCSSTQIESCKRRSKMFPSTTLVEITHGQYSDFPFHSIVDCNYPFERTIDELMKKYREGKLSFKSVMSELLVNQLRQGVLQSTLVAPEIKDLLR